MRVTVLVVQIIIQGWGMALSGSARAGKFILPQAGFSPFIRCKHPASDRHFSTKNELARCPTSKSPGEE
jgi:hypothetical protein